MLAGCSAQLPLSIERADPSQPTHQHIKQANYLAGATNFKPVPAGDWRALNRNVAPEEKKQ